MVRERKQASKQAESLITIVVGSLHYSMTPECYCPPTAMNSSIAYSSGLPEQRWCIQPGIRVEIASSARLGPCTPDTTPAPMMSFHETQHTVIPRLVGHARILCVWTAQMWDRFTQRKLASVRVNALKCISVNVSVPKRVRKLRVYVLTSKTLFMKECVFVSRLFFFFGLVKIMQLWRSILNAPSGFAVVKVPKICSCTTDRRSPTCFKGPPGSSGIFFE